MSIEEFKLPKKLPRDKIAQVYLGQCGNEIIQKKTQARVNWFLDQIESGTVLDIGCSEGILPILLGRKGIEVIGVDINPESIEFAKDLLSKEEPFVSLHVTFVCNDIIQGNWNGKMYDTVVIGEIIEHFSNPEIIINKAIQHLKPKGTLLVTTPFGYLPDPDHKFTFTLTSFLDYFKKQNITPILLEVVDGYIRFSACNVPSEQNHWDKETRNLLALTEKGLLDEQKKLYDQIYEMAKVRQELYATIREIREQKDEITEELKKLNAELKTIHEENQKLDTQCKAMLSIQNDYQQLTVSYDELKKKHDYLTMQINDVTGKLSYRVCQEIASAFKPFRLSSILLPISLSILIWRWLKHNL